MWLGEGRPEWKAEAHWELAQIAIALEDARTQTQKGRMGETVPLFGGEWRLSKSDHAFTFSSGRPLTLDGPSSLDVVRDDVPAMPKGFKPDLD